MSKLFFTEEGRVIPSLCEELTGFRRARKVLELPATNEPATLYLLARSYPDTALPLRLAVNGHRVSLRPDPSAAYRWRSIAVDPAWLREGANTFEMWTGATAMNAWSLAIEGGHAQPASYVTDDGGTTWRNQRMGYLNTLRGEYVVRLRMAEGTDPAPPAMTWECATTPRAQALRDVLPAQARAEGELMGRVRALTSWLASSWEHTNSSRASQYAPWDAATILAWGKAQSGHEGNVPVVMCVHYAVAFVSCCQALGIPARCAVLTREINSGDGHFVAEVWFDEHGKWVMVDPNLDATLLKSGVPLSIHEIQRESPRLANLIEWGPGTAFQRRFPHIVEFITENFSKGLCFRHRSLWPRADLLSHPEASPPGHGSLVYCETGLVWEQRDRDEGLGMFPSFAPPSYFEAPPQAE